MTQTQRYEHIIEHLKQGGLYDPTALYRGTDVSDLRTRGSVETWAVGETEFRDSAEDMDKHGDGIKGKFHNPLYYAFTAGDSPVLVVYKGDSFTNIGHEEVSPSRYNQHTV